MEEDNGYKAMMEQYYQGLKDEAKLELENNSQLVSNFVSQCNNQGIKLTSDNISYTRVIGIVADYPNLTLQLLNSALDKDGLVSVKYLRENFDLSMVARIVYMKADNYMFFPSHYFRRGYAKDNNFAPRFCEIFLALSNNDIDSYIKLDKNRVKLDNSIYCERDSWYGAKFNRDISSLADGVVTLRPSLGLSEFIISSFFANVYSLDIKWSTKDNIKTFVAEEVKIESVCEVIDGVTYYPARYIHAEFDLTKGCFRHFDGAIHLYTEDEYCQRLGFDMNFNSKNDKLIKPKSEKLFKMNGKIDVETWQLFVSHFFTGNPLVFEYFEGEYPDNIKQIVDHYTKQA
ncbi:MAG: hypothetical protein SNJ09_04435 [Rikenellaceae bacterium]